VSCGLDSFLRDAARLLDSGRFALRSLEVYDLFPYTGHVETLAVFAGAR
jgi:tRNA/tmRNA/rRNA uracil-C5-methylase (TrmA/RlmC/RlmD family)